MTVEEKTAALSAEEKSRNANFQLVEHLCSQFLDFAKPLLNSAFDKADDSLFDQADRSENNSQQQAYFETMRSLRVSRSEIVNHFFTLFNKGWRPVKAPPLLTGKVSFDELSLLRKDELEELVATEAMVTRVEDKLSQTLELLLARCGQLNDQIQEDEIPVHPKFLCQSFTNALSKVELDINSKLILLKHFDRHLISNLEPFYTGANHTLIQAGVLPDLKPSKPAPSETSNHPDRAAEDEVTPQIPSVPSSAPTYNSFEDFQNLMHGQAVSGTGPASGSHTIGHGPFIMSGTTSAGSNGIASLQQGFSGGQFVGGTAASSEAVTLPSVQLAQALGQIQANHLEHVGTANISIEEVKTALKQQIADKPLNQVDNDALNLVSMLFEFILDDPQLSVHMKELLGRLQIPMLKVAVLDNSFFSNNQHPARLLLNGLARAGQAWSPQETLAEDKYYQIVSKIIRKVVEGFDQDVSIFIPLNKTISKLLEHQKKQQHKHESEVRQQEEQNALIKMAKAQAADTLESLCLSKSTPAFLKLFLMNNWVKVIEKSLLLEDNGLYEEAINKAETLIWSTDAREIIENRSEFLQRIPPLLSDIRDAAMEFGFPETNMDALFDNLEQIHLDHSRLTLEELEALEEHNLESEAQEQQASITDALNDFELMAETAEATDSGIENVLAESDNTISIETDDQEEATSSDNIIDFNAIKNPKAEDEYYEKLKAFEVGMLFEILNDEKVERKNLTAIIASTQNYIFVDRHGANRSTYHIDDLARALQSGDIKHLDDSLLFDRALEAVIGSLRKNQVAH